MEDHRKPRRAAPIVSRLMAHGWPSGPRAPWNSVPLDFKSCTRAWRWRWRPHCWLTLRLHALRCAPLHPTSAEQYRPQTPVVPSSWPNNYHCPASPSPSPSPGRLPFYRAPPATARLPPAAGPWRFLRLVGVPPATRPNLINVPQRPSDVQRSPCRGIRNVRRSGSREGRESSFR